MAWRNANSLNTLLAETNAIYPDRYKGTDGGISGYTYGPGGVVVNPDNLSSHNINSSGVVCAFDITTGDYPGGISNKDGQAVAERIRIAFRDQPRGLTCYVIHYMEPPYVAVAGPYIATAYDNWAWHTYYGIDLHTSHIHVSVDWDIPAGGAPSGQADYDTTISWNLGSLAGQGSGTTPIPSEEDDMPSLEEIFNYPIQRSDGKGSITLSQLLAYYPADIAGLNANVNKVDAKVSDIKTADGSMSLRQATANAMRAAQKAAAQTADINTAQGPKSLRQFVADGTRAAQKLEPILVDIAKAVVTAPDVDEPTTTLKK